MCRAGQEVSGGDKAGAAPDVVRAGAARAGGRAGLCRRRRRGGAVPDFGARRAVAGARALDRRRVVGAFGGLRFVGGARVRGGGRAGAARVEGAGAEPVRGARDGLHLGGSLERAPRERGQGEPRVAFGDPRADGDDRGVAGAAGRGGGREFGAVGGFLLRRRRARAPGRAGVAGGRGGRGALGAGGERADRAHGALRGVRGGAGSRAVRGAAGAPGGGRGGAGRGLQASVAAGEGFLVG